jgi:ribosomal protein S18 acetylase RimI-like enzyme
MTNFDELDNPIWAALTTGHAALARSAGIARRYASDVSPLAGLKEPTAAAFADLAALVGPEEHVGLFTSEPPELPSGWRVDRSRLIDQMICTQLARQSSSSPLPLRHSDVPEMIALAAETDPGPFLPETIRMGRYFGIRSSGGRLIAMAGERLKLNRFTEVSAVCTSPEFRGHGHARALVEFLVAQAFTEGKVPFLHVKGENTAKSLYEKIGFRVRREIQLTVIGPGASPGTSSEAAGS